MGDGPQTALAFRSLQRKRAGILIFRAPEKPATPVGSLFNPAARNYSRAALRPIAASGRLGGECE
jgi:hypothetical protein